MTQAEKHIQGLLNMGCQEVTSSTRKARCFKRAMPVIAGHTKTQQYYFVGKMGSLRYGRCYTESFALSDWQKEEVDLTPAR